MFEDNWDFKAVGQIVKGPGGEVVLSSTFPVA